MVKKRKTAPVKLDAKTWHVRLDQGLDGYIVAQCIELPAAISQGSTRDEALKNMHEAITVTLQGMRRASKAEKAEIVEITL